jgi:hypothetical protein
MRAVSLRRHSAIARFLVGPRVLRTLHPRHHLARRARRACFARRAKRLRGLRCARALSVHPVRLVEHAAYHKGGATGFKASEAFHDAAWKVLYRGASCRIPRWRECSRRGVAAFAKTGFHKRPNGNPRGVGVLMRPFLRRNLQLDIPIILANHITPGSRLSK